MSSSKAPVAAGSGDAVDEASPPSKRPKTTPAQVSGSSLPLVFKLAMPFCDQDDLLFRLSEVSKDFQVVALNEVVRRFKIEHEKLAKANNKWSEEEDDNDAKMIVEDEWKQEMEEIETSMLGEDEDEITFACRCENINRTYGMFGCDCANGKLSLSFELSAANSMPEGLLTPEMKVWVVREVNTFTFSQRNETILDPTLLTEDAKYTLKQGQHSWNIRGYDARKVQRRLEQRGHIELGNLHHLGVQLEANISNITLTAPQLEMAAQDPLPILFEGHEGLGSEWIEALMEGNEGLMWWYHDMENALACLEEDNSVDSEDSEHGDDWDESADGDNSDNSEHGDDSGYGDEGADGDDDSKDDAEDDDYDNTLWHYRTAHVALKRLIKHSIQWALLEQDPTFTVKVLKRSVRDTPPSVSCVCCGLTRNPQETSFLHFAVPFFNDDGSFDCMVPLVVHCLGYVIKQGPWEGVL